MTLPGRRAFGRRGQHGADRRGGEGFRVQLSEHVGNLMLKRLVDMVIYLVDMMNDDYFTRRVVDVRVYKLVN